MKIYLITLLFLGGCTETINCTLESPYKEALTQYTPEKYAYFYYCMGINRYQTCYSFDYCLREWQKLGKPEEKSNGIVEGAAILGGAHILGKLIK